MRHCKMRPWGNQVLYQYRSYQVAIFLFVTAWSNFLFIYPFRDSTPRAAETTVHVSSYYYMCVIILLRRLIHRAGADICPHTTKTPNPHTCLELLLICPHPADYLRNGCSYVSSCYQLPHARLKHMCPHSNTCVLILLHTCPHTTNLLITLGMDAQSTW